ncbi:hypothetical protein EPI10_004429 [Gossypium australe]|uniref:Uncharacterized protein n=1 Tax=Gossypium australe TaxID=47621 RepID=A0A5B6WL75_9ROSI|nr:hypothetical protein EPI10_004429 [Gossypium australe]
MDQFTKNSNPNTQEQEILDEQGSNNCETFGPKLRRNNSVSSAYALQLQVAVKRAFSMRRSSSVSERYCRIYDQCMSLGSPFVDEEWDVNGTRRSDKKKKNIKGKILKVWKKLFRL